MPVKSSRQWRFFGAARSGKVPGVSPEVAKEMMDKTPTTKRKQFAKALPNKRSRRAAALRAMQR